MWTGFLHSAPQEVGLSNLDKGNQGCAITPFTKSDNRFFCLQNALYCKHPYLTAHKTFFKPYYLFIKTDVYTYNLSLWSIINISASLNNNQLFEKVNIVEYILTPHEITKTMFYIFLDTLVYFKQSDTYFIEKYMQKDRYLFEYTAYYAYVTIL